MVIPPRQALKTVGMANLPVLSKRVNIATEAIAGFQEGKLELCPSYEYVKPGSLKVAVALYNNTWEKIALTKRTIVAKVTTVNAIPPMLAPTKSMYHDIPKYDENQKLKTLVLGNIPKSQNEVQHQPLKPEPTQEHLNKLFSKLDLKGIEDWPEADQNEVCEVMKEYQHLFALDDTELGCTSLVKHKIELNDPKPFKDRYRRILPNQFKEV